HKRPYQALDMKVPAELYSEWSRVYSGLAELEYPFHDRSAIVTSCGRICYRITVASPLPASLRGIGGMSWSQIKLESLASREGYSFRNPRKYPEQSFPVPEPRRPSRRKTPFRVSSLRVCRDSAE